MNREWAGSVDPASIQCFLSVSMPFTLPRQVSPAYGTLIESVPSVAEPVSVIAQDVSPGPVALPAALQLIAVGEDITPCAVPVNFRSPAQLALKAPFAVVAVCSETFQLKSVQVLGVGINVDDVQLPSSELLPDALGSVDELRCSNPAHPVATLAAMQTAAIMSRLFIIFIPVKPNLKIPVKPNLKAITT
jgi:hypothetical protein